MKVCRREHGMHQLLKSTVQQPIVSLPFGSGFQRFKQKLGNLKIVFAACPLESIADVLGNTFQGVNPSRCKLRNQKQVCVEHVQTGQYKHDASYHVEDFLITREPLEAF